LRIVVTGATGFLGTALCARLEREGHEVLRLNSRNCDLTRAESLEAFNPTAFDRIYHLAAWTQAGDFCLRHPGEQWLINQRINTHVLAWWQARQPQAKLIAMGTSCAYAPEADLVEENYLAGLPIESLFTYAMTKRMLYTGLLALQKQFGLKFLCLVPSTLYGPGYHADGRQMHFIFDLIRKILRGKLLDEPVVLWGDGYQTRELVYLDDFVTLALELERTRDNDLVNLGAGEEFSIRHFARLICEQVGYDFHAIQFDTSRYVGARSKCLAIGKLRRLLPNLRFTPLETGLARTIQWFQTAGWALLQPKERDPG
jgi:GDP-L-fucose synthase